MAKMVYICSPCRGDYEKNIDNAVTYSRMAFQMGYIPITPHIYFTRFMDDTNSKERNVAMGAGLQLLLLCSEIWVFGLDHPSEGMQAEIALAIRHNIPVKDGEMMLTANRNKELVLPLTGDVVHRHVEWLTSHFGLDVANRWKKTNQKYAASMQEAEQKYAASMQHAGESARLASQRLNELTEFFSKKGASHD